MAVASTNSPAGRTSPPLARKLRRLSVPAAYRRRLVWAQIILTFVLLELVLWAPSPEARNRWAAATMITILVLLLIDHPSLERLGLRLPTAYGASIVLGIGTAAVVFLIALVILAGGQIPPHSVWPKLQSAWGYVIWAFLQEFILQSFFFNRCQQLYGGRAAVWMAATLFAAAHLPNAPLTVAALVGALFFCEMFRRYPSIYPLGTVHAMLGVTLAVIAPDRLLHHMRVGIGYLRY